MNATFPYRMAVFDMDDTLLGPDKKISAENRLALARLRAAGVEVVIASGRYQGNVIIFEESLGFLGWIISSGGAVVSNGATGEIIHELTVPHDLALEVFHRGREDGLCIVGYRRAGIFCNAQSEWTDRYKSVTGQVPTADISALTESGLQKLIWITAPRRILELTPRMQEEYRDRLYVVNTESEMLEFLNPNTNKARAIEILAGRLNIPREQIITFGDGNNDVPMLTWAGMSVAMAHGRESARQAARRVSPPGDPATAVARSLDLFFPPGDSSSSYPPASRIN
jgi:Cof subfamily protein (haloacid dehalogenase superfamily)